jgi:hypothetical protein
MHGDFSVAFVTNTGTHYKDMNSGNNLTIRISPSQFLQMRKPPPKQVPFVMEGFVCKAKLKPSLDVVPALVTMPEKPVFGGYIGTNVVRPETKSRLRGHYHF